MDVNLTDSSQIAISLDYISPDKIKESLEDIDEIFYANLLASVVRHCIENTMKLNGDIRQIIERI
jgi:hypothetical protein